MTRPTHESLLGALALSVAFVGVAHAQSTERTSPLVLAQAPPPLTEQEKAKRKEQERQKGAPGDKKGFPDRGPPAKAQTPTTPPGTPPAGKNVLTPPDKVLPPKGPTAQPFPSGPPPAGKSFEPPTRKATDQPFERKKFPDG